MVFSLLFNGIRPRNTTRSCAVSCFRPQLEGLEERVVLSSPGSLVVPELAPAQLATLSDRIADAVNLDISITEVQLNEAGNGLIAVGTIAGQTFESPLTIALAEDQTGASEDCPILDLSLGPIDLNLLGLQVVTSEICLRVNAESGPGNLLGNLLCEVGGLLDGGLNLGGALGTLSAAQTDDLTSGLTGLIDQTLQRALNRADTQLVEDDPDTENVTEILSLSVGPVDLNVLGLDVELDDCDGGPVTVDVNAIAGPGNLLGNLLTGLSGLLDGGVNFGQINQIVNRVGQIFDRLDNLLEDGLSPVELERLGNQVDRILDSIGGLLDRADSRAEQVLDRIEGQLDRLVNRVERLVERSENQAERIVDRVERQLDRLANRLEDRVEGLTEVLDEVFARLDDLI